MPWEDHYIFFAPATGLPPQVMLYSYIRGLKKEVTEGFANIPKVFRELFDERTMNGQLSLTQLTRAVEDGPKMNAMANDIAAMRSLIEQYGYAAAAAGEGAGMSQRNVARPNIRLVRQYVHSSDGKCRRIPADWTFPSLPLQAMYVYWHCGEDDKIPPMKWFQNDDVSFLKRGRQNLSECRKVMTAIDNEAEKKGVKPRDIMTQVETNTCYYNGESAILTIVPSTTNKARVRNVSRLKWSTVVRFMRIPRRNRRS